DTPKLADNTDLQRSQSAQPKGRRTPMTISRRGLSTTIGVTGVLLSAFRLSDASATASEEKAAVASATEAFRNAMLTGDAVQLENLCASGMQYCHSSGRVQSKAD